MVLSLQVVRSFVVVNSTSDPLVERSFVMVLSASYVLPSLFLPEKRRENDFGGIRTPDFFLFVKK